MNSGNNNSNNNNSNNNKKKTFIEILVSYALPILSFIISISTFLFTTFPRMNPFISDLKALATAGKIREQIELAEYYYSVGNTDDSLYLYNQIINNESDGLYKSVALNNKGFILLNIDASTLDTGAMTYNISTATTCFYEASKLGLTEGRNNLTLMLMHTPDTFYKDSSLYNGIFSYDLLADEFSSDYSNEIKRTMLTYEEFSLGNRIIPISYESNSELLQQVNDPWALATRDTYNEFTSPEDYLWDTEDTTYWSYYSTISNDVSPSFDAQFYITSISDHSYIHTDPPYEKEKNIHLVYDTYNLYYRYYATIGLKFVPSFTINQK